MFFPNFQKTFFGNPIRMSFEVIVCQDRIPVPYHLLTPAKNGLMTIKPQILADIIVNRYNDHIIQNIGLLIELFDIVRGLECKCIPDTPVAYAHVIFRYIVFRPKVGSVWNGTILACNEDGITICLSFFKDIWVPWDNLPIGSYYQFNKWLWNCQENEESEENNQTPLEFGVGESVRFRVCDVVYHQKESDGPLMLVIATMATAGLGPISWW